MTPPKGSPVNQSSASADTVTRRRRGKGKATSPPGRNIFQNLSFTRSGAIPRSPLLPKSTAQSNSPSDEDDSHSIELSQSKENTSDTLQPSNPLYTETEQTNLQLRNRISELENALYQATKTQSIPPEHEEIPPITDYRQQRDRTRRPSPHVPSVGPSGFSPAIQPRVEYRTTRSPQEDRDPLRAPRITPSPQLNNHLFFDPALPLISPDGA